MNCLISWMKIIVTHQSGFRPAGGRNGTRVSIDFGPALVFSRHYIKCGAASPVTLKTAKDRSIYFLPKLTSSFLKTSIGLYNWSIGHYLNTVYQ